MQDCQGLLKGKVSLRNIFFFMWPLQFLGGASPVLCCNLCEWCCWKVAMVTWAHWAAGQVFIVISVNTITQLWGLLATSLFNSCSHCKGDGMRKRSIPFCVVPPLIFMGRRPWPTWGIKTNQIVVTNVLLHHNVCISNYPRIVMSKYFLDSGDSI